MSTIINGSSPSITFSDSTTQSTAGLTSSSTQVCQAWVNFNGVTTATIRASYNVSSVTYVTTGVYTINFTNALVDANYAAVVGGGNTSGNGGYIRTNYSTTTSSSLKLVTVNASASAFLDFDYVSVAVFR